MTQKGTCTVGFDRDSLYDAYVCQGKDTQSVADMFGCSIQSVRKWLKDWGIRIRHSKRPNICSKEWLTNAHITEKRPLAVIAAEVGVQQSTVAKWMRQFDIPVRTVASERFIGRVGSYWQTKEWLLDSMRRHNQSVHAVAKEIGVTDSTIARRLDSLCIARMDRSERNKHHVQRNEFSLSFFQSWSRELGWFLGYAFADGCVTGNSLVITSTDRELIEKAAYCVEFQGNIIAQDRGRYQTRYVLRITHPLLPAILSGYNLVPRKSLIAEMPLHIPADCVGDFVRGNLDGDGTARVFHGTPNTTGLALSFATGSQIFADGLQQTIQQSCGVQGKVSVTTPRDYPASRIYTLFYCGTLDVLRLLDLIYRDSRGLYLQRKRDNANIYMKFLVNATPKTMRWNRWTPDECEYVRSIISQWPTIDHS